MTNGKSKSIVVEPEKFVRAWQEANSLVEVCKTLKLRGTERIRKALYNRAYYYRRNGVVLQKLTPSGGSAPKLDRPDWKALARLSQGYALGHKRGG